MTNTVSLLSAEYRREMGKARRLRKIRTIAAIVAAVMLLAAAGAVGLRLAGEQAVSALHEQNEEAQKQIAKLAVYEQLHYQLTALEGKITSVRALDQGWIAAVGAIGDALPEGVWLERLGSGEVQEDKVRTMELECGANSYEEIARTMMALKEKGAVESARCTASSDTDGTVRFTLTVTLAAPSDK